MYQRGEVSNVELSSENLCQSHKGSCEGMGSQSSPGSPIASYVRLMRLNSVGGAVLLGGGLYLLYRRHNRKKEAAAEKEKTPAHKSDEELMKEGAERERKKIESAHNEKLGALIASHQ